MYLNYLFYMIEYMQHEDIGNYTKLEIVNGRYKFVEMKRPNTILEEDNKNEKREPRIDIRFNDICKSYKFLAHYSNIETFSYILGKQTLRCSSLNNARLNDLFEWQRKNI